MQAGRLSGRELALFAAPCLGLGAIGVPLSVYLPSFYSAQLGLNLSAVGLSFMAVRLVDIGVDPALGLLMDHSRTRFGRFRPWLAAGVPLLMLAAGLLFFARRGVGPAYLAGGLALVYGGWSMCVVAQTAWGARLSPRYDERSRVYGWWQVFNLVGQLAILVAPVLASRVDPAPASAVHAMGLYVLLVLPAAAALAIAFAPEPPPGPPPAAFRWSDGLGLFRSSAVRRLLFADLLMGLAYGVGGALFLFFFTKAKGFPPAFASVGLLLYYLGALLGGPLWTLLARRTDKPTTLAAASLASIAGLIVLYVIPNGAVAWGVVASVISGLPNAAANQISRAMMADAADEERLASGTDHTGLLYALLSSTAKIGAALAVGITFVGLDKLAGFDAASDHNGPVAILGLHAFFLGLPAVLFTLAAAVLIGYPLTRGRHDEIRRALESQSAAS